MEVTQWAVLTADCVLPVCLMRDDDLSYLPGNLTVHYLCSRLHVYHYYLSIILVTRSYKTSYLPGNVMYIIRVSRYMFISITSLLSYSFL